MAKIQKFSLAVFETPTECRECPCAYITVEYGMDVCQLTGMLLKPASGIALPIPDWCPLKPVVFEEGYAK